MKLSVPAFGGISILGTRCRENIFFVSAALLLLRSRGEKYLTECEQVRNRVTVGKETGRNGGKKYLWGVGVRWY